MFAINAPREVVAAVRKKGFQGLTPEEAAHIPTADRHEERRPHAPLQGLVRRGRELPHGRSDEQWQAMLNAQCTWDATMGWNAVAPLAKDADPEDRHGRARRRGARAVRPRHRAAGAAVVRRTDRVGDPASRSRTTRRARSSPSRPPTRTSSGAFRPRPARSIPTSASRRARGPTTSGSRSSTSRRTRRPRPRGFQLGDVLADDGRRRRAGSRDARAPRWPASAGATRRRSRCGAEKRRAGAGPAAAPSRRPAADAKP